MLFVDESAFISLNSPVSPRHEDALSYVQSLVDQTIRVCTDRYAVSAAANELKAKSGGAIANRFIELLHAGDIRILPCKQHIYEKAEELFKEHVGKSDISFTDCIHAAMMKHYHITKVFAFKPHLGMLHINTVPKR